jgi:hypothetical protein
MPTHRSNALLLALICCAFQWTPATAVPAQSDSIVDKSLGEQMGFSTADIQSVEAGSAVIRSLDAPVREELAYVGLVHVDASAARFVDRFRNIEEFESGPGTPLIGRFGNPPELDDLARLTLPAADVAALSKCRPGSCDVKLSSTAMERFRNDVDWSSADAAAEANRVARQMILDLVEGYMADGNASLGYYDGEDDSVPFSEHFRDLLASQVPLPVPIPELFSYLETYPQGRPEGADDFFYWTLVDFGLKQTIRVNHVTIYALNGSEVPSERVAYAIAIKQIYASHYFYSTLELRFLVDDAPSAAEGSSLVSITRSRSDGLTGLTGLFLRPIITRRSRDGVRNYLQHVKQQIERPGPASP